MQVNSGSTSQPSLKRNETYDTLKIISTQLSPERGKIIQVDENVELTYSQITSNGQRTDQRKGETEIDPLKENQDMLEKFRTQIKYIIQTLDDGTDDIQLKGQLKGLNTKILEFIRKILTEEMNQPKMYENWLLGLNQAAMAKSQ